MSDAKTVLTTEQIAELRRLERAWHDAPDHTLERTGAKAEYEMCIRNAAPALLDAAERCGEAQATLDTIAHMVDAVHDQSTGPSYPGTDDEVMSAIANLRADLARVTVERDEALEKLVALRESGVTIDRITNFVAFTDEAKVAYPVAPKFRVVRDASKEHARIEAETVASIVATIDAHLSDLRTARDANGGSPHWTMSVVDNIIDSVNVLRGRIADHAKGAG